MGGLRCGVLSRRGSKSGTHVTCERRQPRHLVQAGHLCGQVARNSLESRGVAERTDLTHEVLGQWLDRLLDPTPGFLNSLLDCISEFRFVIEDSVATVLERDQLDDCPRPIDQSCTQSIDEFAIGEISEGILAL